MQISKTASYALIAFSYFGGWAWMNYDAVLHKVAITQETLTIDIEKGDSVIVGCPQNDTTHG